MEKVVFKIVGQKTSEDKLILMAVVNGDFLGDVPAIFETMAVKMPATVYTGTFPTVRIDNENIKDITDEFTGMGVAGIISEPIWICKTQKEHDILGIGISKRK